ncbi:hypothetical protein LOD99_5416 [Oopsacas minuta]|uniref:Uncharacterized protein n=1 Tax=Oopsacas minuta TaxID=111878 RepID=A0AAV7JQX5_9METZ|nr:hypothetical protein LOD99_5416 [Oopsacas minuta]
MRAVEEKIASFSRLAKYLEDNKLSFGLVKDVVLQHLDKLKKRFEQYFSPEDAMVKEIVGWVLNPFKCFVQIYQRSHLGWQSSCLNCKRTKLLKQISKLWTGSHFGGISQRDLNH